MSDDPLSENNKAAIRMLRRWMTDPEQAEYDERAWPIAKAAMTEQSALRRIARMIEGWQAAGEVPAEEMLQYLLEEVYRELSS